MSVNKVPQSRFSSGGILTIATEVYLILRICHGIDPSEYLRFRAFSTYRS